MRIRNISFVLGILIAGCVFSSVEGFEKEVPCKVMENKIIVNKINSIDETYVPNELVVPNVMFSFSGEHEKKYMQKDAARALEELFIGAQNEGIKLAAVSGYRSYGRQKSIYASNVNAMGQAAADRVSAKPGHSEHQTGLAMDISASSVGYDLTETLEDTKEGKWLRENAHKYGFIIRYPKDKEEITGYSYEPWHVRYIGIKDAMYIYKNELTLEEANYCTSGEMRYVAITRVECVDKFSTVVKKGETIDKDMVHR